MYQLDLTSFLKAIGITTTYGQQNYLDYFCLNQEHYFEQEQQFLENNLYDQFPNFLASGMTINAVIGRFLDFGKSDVVVLDYNVKNIYETAVAADVRLNCDQLMRLHQYARTDYHWIEGEKHFLLENIANDTAYYSACIYIN